MKMETRIAISNLKYHKNKNILTGIAIFLTSLLLFLVPTIGMDLLNAQFAVVNEIYPTWHALFRDVDDKTAQKLSVHHDIAVSGLRSDVGSMALEEAQVSMMYMDEEAFFLYRMNLMEGNFPEKENEIVVSQGILEELGQTAEIGDTITVPYQIDRDGGLDYTQTGEFVISGMVEDTEASKEKRMYSAFVSKAFVEKEVPQDQIRYRFLFQVNGKKNAMTDDVEGTIHKIATQFDITEDNTRINTEYLMANYVDPTVLPVIIGIMLIIVFAGIITIYSIYYVNMPDRIQEFGRLKAIGATKKQIRKIVFREGFAVTMIALPIGLILGTLLTKVTFYLFLNWYGNENQNIIMSTMKEMLDANRISLYQGWIYLLTIAVTIITVYLSLYKPMKIAAKISEIDAIRFQVQTEKKTKRKKNRKSLIDVSIFKLSRIYLFGNKKNSVITILSMGITGMFLMVVATVLSCANPRESANNSIDGQYRISLVTESGNKEHPEREWKNVIQNNPLDDALKESIEKIQGVKSVACFSSVKVTSEELRDRESILGVPEESKEDLMKGIIEGKVSYEELSTGESVIVEKNLIYWNPDIKVGDTLNLRIEDGEESHTATVKVAAIGDYSIGFTDYEYLLMSEEGVKKLCNYNTNSSYHIFANEDYDEKIDQELELFTQENELLQLRTWKAQYEEWKSAISMTSNACYVFVSILGAICVLNMINTMIHSVHTRKKEIGMMQAIGMTDQQLVRMLMQEGLFYTIGTLILSVGVGSLLGYPIFLWAKSEGMFSISHYHYPTIVALIVVGVLLGIQIILAIALGKTVKKESLIERIHFD